VAGIAEDITDRREQEETLRRTERLASVGTLAAGIAHEINNPVGGILLAAQFARLKIDSSDDVLKALRDIEHDAKRCGQIVSSILRLARQDSSEKRPSCLNDVARAAIEVTGSYATRHGALLRFEPAEALPEALVNDTEMEQALVNLIRNAVEAGRDGVTIHVTTRVHKGNPQVVVRDDGPGLSSEQLERLFDPFYTTRRSSGGWGLGLSLTHAIVTDHRGTIEVESAPGQGAAFTIELRAA
jgi:signal transduction histidine kinase